MTTLVLANLFEFNWRRVRAELGGAEFDAWSRPGIDLSDMALFWGGDDSIIVTPEPLDPTWMADACRQLGWSKVSNASPGRYTGQICLDLLADTSLLDEVIRSLHASPVPELSAWGATPALAELIGVLHSAVPHLQTPSLPPVDFFWLADQADSKANFRHLVSALGNNRLSVPRGFVFSDIPTSLDALDMFAHWGCGAAVKAAGGTAGFSIIRFSKEQLLVDAAKCRRQALARMRFDSTWTHGPIVVEQWIEATDSNDANVPTGDFLVDESGDVSVVGLGQMKLRREQHYGGIVAGRHAIAANLHEKVVAAGMAVGGALAKEGFRGLYDIDFVIGADGVLYATEMNARRASPSHVFNIARTLRGNQWHTTSAVVANDHVPLKGAIPTSYSDLKSITDKHARQGEQDGVQIVITIVSSSVHRRTPYFGYALVADSLSAAKQSAQLLEDRVAQLIAMRGGD